tara:strand:- start:120 stop:380 length:261 start_codon:yes stop_codon:yes gene_type:complete
VLQEHNVPVPPHVILDRSGGRNPELIEREDAIIVDGQVGSHVGGCGAGAGGGYLSEHGLLLIACAQVCAPVFCCADDFKAVCHEAD